MTDCYDYPGYYEIAFDFRDLPAEVAVIDRLHQEFSPQTGKSVLQLACGPAQHLPALHAAGFGYSGLDLSKAMLERAKAVANEICAPAKFYHASMVDFQLPEQVDIVFVALGDLYAQNAAEVDSFLDSCAAALNPGGLILLDWCVQFQPEKTFRMEGDSWSMERGNIHVDARVSMVPVSPVEQSFDEVLELTLDDNGQRRELRSVARKYALYPQQFLTLIEAHPALEFCGWWNDWDPDKPLTSETMEIYRPITLVRKLENA